MIAGVVVWEYNHCACSYPAAQDFNNDDDKGDGREWVGRCADSGVVLSKMDAGDEGSGPTLGFDLSGILADSMSMSTGKTSFFACGCVDHQLLQQMGPGRDSESTGGWSRDYHASANGQGKLYWWWGKW
jgi:hypothetical protein